MLTADCPRCGQDRTTFDLLASTIVWIGNERKTEAFCRCRKCRRTSIALLEKQLDNVDDPMDLQGDFVDFAFPLAEWIFEVPNRRDCPNYVPPDVQRVFNEAATCAAIGAWDAAGTMFRKVLDVGTRTITPSPESEVEKRPPNWKVYKDLRPRLDWLFDNDLLPASLRELSSCIHEDGNDAAHDTGGITKAEAEDLGDFTESVLETLYTLPGQIAENRKRRDARRGVIVE